MKVNRFIFLFSIIGAFLLGSCNKAPTIPSEDKIAPTETSLEYTDYGASNELKFELNSSKWYRNDLELGLPDPCIVYEDGTYYIFGTTDRTGAKSFDCYSTTDFSSYKYYKDIYAPTDTTWGNGSLFAPEIVKIDDLYYMYYNASHYDGVETEKSGIMIAVSENITGPYRDYVGEDANGNPLDNSKGPIIRDINASNYGILDVTTLFDGDDMYLYWSVYEVNIMQYIVGVKMIDPVTPDWSTYQVLIRPGAINANDRYDTTLSWEAYKGFRVAEGPQVTKIKDGRYMISYSVNHYPDKYYTVCYAIGDNPLGPFEKPYVEGENWSNILFGYAGLQNGTVFDQWAGFTGGCGHHYIFKVGDQYMIAYHAFKNRNDISSGRCVAIDYLFFDEEGNPYVHGPSYSAMPLPEATSGYKNIALNAKVIAEGTETPDRLNDNYIVEHYNLAQEANKEADFKGGQYCYIQIQFDKEYTIGGLAIFNSAYYEKVLYSIDFINFGNSNAILNSSYNRQYVEDAKEFAFPCGNFAYDFDDIKTNKITIGINSAYDFSLNEIIVLGK